MYPISIPHILLPFLVVLHLSASIPLTPINNDVINQNLTIDDIPLDFEPSQLQQNPTLTTITNLTTSLDNTACVPKGPAMRDKWRPYYKDCALALRKFSTSPEMHDYYTHPYSNALLPASHAHGNCRMTVTLGSDVMRERCSWAEVGLAAMQMLNGCYDSEKSAGSTWVGGRGKMKIEASKIRGWVDGG